MRYYDTIKTTVIGTDTAMRDILDFRDYALFLDAQRELWREAEMRRLAHEVRRSPRRSVVRKLTARLSEQRPQAA